MVVLYGIKVSFSVSILLCLTILGRQIKSSSVGSVECQFPPFVLRSSPFNLTLNGLAAQEAVQAQAALADGAATAKL